MFIIYVLPFLVLSIALNIFLYIKLKSSKHKPEASYEASDLLSDLLKGRALIEVRRIAPESVFLHSPGRMM